MHQINFNELKDKCRLEPALFLSREEKNRKERTPGKKYKSSLYTTSNIDRSAVLQTVNKAVNQLSIHHIHRQFAKLRIESLIDANALKGDMHIVCDKTHPSICQRSCISMNKNEQNRMMRRCNDGLLPLFEWTRPFHDVSNRLKHPMMMTSSNRFTCISPTPRLHTAHWTRYRFSRLIHSTALCWRDHDWWGFIHLQKKNQQQLPIHTLHTTWTSWLLTSQSPTSLIV